MAGSLVANKIGSDQQSAARQKVIQDNNQRQFDLQTKSNDSVNQTVAKVTPTATAANTATEAANQTANDSALIDSNAGGIKQVTGSAPQEVSNSTARAVSDALARGKTQAGLNAKTGAVKRVGLENNIAIGQGALQQQQLGGAMTRTAALMPAELDDANRAGSGARGVGQILQLASSGTGMAGLTGAGPSWGDLFGTGPMASSTTGLTQQGFFPRMASKFS